MTVERPKRVRRRRGVWVVGVLVVASMALAACPAAVLARLQRVDVPDTGRGDGTTWLVIGSDSRARTPRGVTKAQFNPTGQVTGSGADVVLLVHRSSTGEVHTVAVPRDLVVKVNRVPQRLTSTLQGGAGDTVRALCATLQVGIDHVVIVDGSAFVDTVDALGGVSVTLEHPVRDADLGLDLPAGDQHLSGTQALALTRTRHPEQFIRQRWIASTDVEGAKWRSRWSALVFEAAQERLRSADPVTLASVAWSVSGNVVVDDRMGAADLWDLGRSVAAPTELPVTSVNELVVTANAETRRVLSSAQMSDACQAV